MGENQPRILVIWGRYQLPFDSDEPERYGKDLPDAEIQERFLLEEHHPVIHAAFKTGPEGCDEIKRAHC
jgi:hypothetical protein